MGRGSVAHNGRVQPVVTPAEMGEADRRAIAQGTPEPVLIGRAAGAVAMHAVRMLRGTYGRRVVVAAGKGNNGADGRDAADRLRRRGVGVDVFAVADELGRDEFLRALKRAHLFIDAMFGTGFRGALAEPAAWIAETVREQGTRTLAIDIPSGVDGATGEVAGAAAVRADETITFVAREARPDVRTRARPRGASDRRRHRHRTRPHRPIRARSGRPPPAARATRPRDKWSSGLMVFGGSNGLTGAPLMAARAGACAGAGMVVCSLPGHEAAAAASGAEIVTRAMPATEDGAMAEDAARVASKDISRFARSRSVPAWAATTAPRPRRVGWSRRRRSPS